MASFKFRSNGKVQITITHGTKFDGTPKRFYREVPYTTDRQLQIDAALFLADVVNGVASISCSSTIDTLFKSFIKEHTVDVGLKGATSGRYEQLYNNQIAKYFSSRQINKITRSNVREWVKHISKHGHAKTGGPLKPKTVKNALSLLSSMFNYAIFDLEIIDKNPCEKIRIPKSDVPAKSDKDFYSEQELISLFLLLLEKRKDPRSITHATVIFLILFTGMRTGEVMGLRWEDVNFEENKLYIYEERIYVANVGILTDSPKTPHSIREISFPAFLGDMLKDLKAHQQHYQELLGEEYQNTGFVAVIDAGTPQHPRNTYKWFKRFLKANNLKDTTVHDLRHTHVAILSRLGIKIIDASKRLGHANTRITQETYDYLFNDIDDDISNELDTYYKKIMEPANL